jgi:3-methyl-2-oxobutanoate hydroxymethyltransferase
VRNRYPCHSKKYADFIALEAELQEKRLAALRAFADDVRDWRLS